VVDAPRRCCVRMGVEAAAYHAATEECRACHSSPDPGQICRQSPVDLWCYQHAVPVCAQIDCERGGVQALSPQGYPATSQRCRWQVTRWLTLPIHTLGYWNVHGGGIVMFVEGHPKPLRTTSVGCRRPKFAEFSARHVAVDHGVEYHYSVKHVR